MGLHHEARLVLVAVQFLTRLPVRIPLQDGRFDPAWLHACARHFPLVGAVVGGWGALVLCGAAALWPPVVAVLLSMAATVWLTGGFHEDGVADTCDGLGGAVTRERALEIMKDSRLGSYGALGLGLTLALKAAALTALLATAGPALTAAALVLAHGLSRAATVVMLRLLPYGGDLAHAKAKPLAQQISRPGLAVALGWGALLAAAAVLAGWPPLRVLAVVAAMALVVAVCTRWLRQRLGGYTGDALGATQQWTELAAYLALAAAVPGVGGLA